MICSKYLSSYNIYHKSTFLILSPFFVLITGCLELDERDVNQATSTHPTTGGEDTSGLVTKFSDMHVSDNHAEDMYAEDMYTEDMYAADIYVADMQTEDMHVFDVNVADMQAEGMNVADMYLADMTLSVCGDGEISDSEQCDDGNLDSGDGCNSLCYWEADPCDGIDNNGDGQIDELVYDAPSSLIITFGSRTGIEAGQGSISILDFNGEHVEGSPFIEQELTSRIITLPGNGFTIKLTLREGSQASYGYEITEITDQNGRVIEGPYPVVPSQANGFLNAPLNLNQYFSVGDSRGAGTWCGIDEGECELSLTSCADGFLSCQGMIEVNSETCDGLDNDCDGTIDELIDLEPQLCPLQEGVCEGAYANCEGGYWRCDYASHHSQYQVREEGCDCLDNDCDGEVDRSGGSPLNCTLMDAIANEEHHDRECVIQRGGSVPSGIHSFRTLTIEDGVHISVIPDTGCGYKGQNECTEGGGCLLIKANQVNVHGDIDVNAAVITDPSQPPSGVDRCPGASGGDLKFEAHHFFLDGVLEANGGDAWKRDEGEADVGGGAGGSIKIRAEQIELGANAVIRSIGGRGVSRDREELLGRGAGAEGGHGGGAGATAGFDVEHNHGNADPSRSVAIIGNLISGHISQVQIGTAHANLQTLATPYGFLDLGGSASSLAMDDQIPYTLEINRDFFVLHLVDHRGQARPGQLLQRQDSGSLMNSLSLGMTDEEGWLFSVASATPETSYLINLPSEDALGFTGHLFYNYYDLATNSSCSGLVPVVDQTALVGVLNGCD